MDNMTLTVEEEKEYLDLYEMNRRFSMEGFKLHHEFLKKKGITDRQYNKIIDKIIIDSLDHTIKEVYNILNK